jgi:uncharacterized membrane-anchored protein YitT (DUF2179 family)
LIGLDFIRKNNYNMFLGLENYLLRKDDSMDMENSLILRSIKSIAGITIGAILLAIAINAIIIPTGLLSGGAGGLALVGQYLFKLPVDIGMLLINIPIFIWGIKELNKRFIVYSLIGTAVTIIAIPITRPLVVVPKLDLFLASITSGVLMGIGVGLILKCGASTGGTDIVAMIMKKKKNMSVGTVSFAFNLIVLAISAFYFNLSITLYTAVSMYVTGKVIDFVLEGLNRNKSIMIVSDKSHEIADKIMKELGRGVTYLEGQGAYSGEQKLVINCVVNNFEVAKVKEIVREFDKQAFMFFTDTAEVSGKGFTS